MTGAHRTGGVNPRLAFTYVFGIYLLAAASETFISPLFPLIREDLGLVVSQQAVILATLTVSIGVFNVVGGALGHRTNDRTIVRIASLLLGAGALLSGSANAYWVMLVGQALLGMGGGMFFGPGLASVGRLYPQSRGKAIALYGLAYSVGLAFAAFAANLGLAHWRWAFWATAILAFLGCVVSPQLVEAGHDTPPPLLSSLRTYLTAPLYRIALGTGVVAGSTHYVVIGFVPVLFVDRGADLGLVAGLIGIGRLASAGGKVAGGWLYDRIGGPQTAAIVMAVIVALGVPQLGLPGTSGMVIIIPFVCVTAMLFPVSNALSVAALPPRSSWGIGVYRAVLMISSAVVSAIVGLALRFVSLQAVMLATLALPLVGSVAIGLLARSTGREIPGAAPLEPVGVLGSSPRR